MSVQDDWSYRLALLCHAFGGVNARELIDGLAENPKATAQQCMENLSQLEPHARRARVAGAFRDQVDAEAAFRRLVRDTAGPLRKALLRAAPARWRTAMAPGPGPLDPGVEGPGMVRFAERLIRETSS